MGIPWLRFGPPKLVESRGIERFSSKNTTFPKLRKTPKSSTFTHGFGRNHKEKNRKMFMHTSPIKSQREMPQIHHKKFAKKGSENHQKGKTGNNTRP
jgi:hypothetical protein